MIGSTTKVVTVGDEGAGEVRKEFLVPQARSGEEVVEGGLLHWRGQIVVRC